MPFAFTAKNKVGQQVRTIAKGQAEKALSKARAGGDFDKTVHELRRRCKKIRGLLRLVQPNFEDFKAENAAVRDAADLLGGARDARVMVETLDRLTIAGHSQAVREYLVERADRVAAQTGKASPIEEFCAIFEDLEQRVEDWSFDANGFDLVGDGLQKTYRQFVQDLDSAAGSEDPVAMHEWRKQAKYHWFHVSLMERSAPDLLKPRADALDKLGEYLGDHHNLHVLEEALTEGDERFDEIEPILAAIEGQQDELARKAFALGHQLAAEKPSALRDRVAAYWSLLPVES